MCQPPAAQVPAAEQRPPKRGYGIWLLAAGLCLCVGVWWWFGDVPGGLADAAATAEHWESSYPNTTRCVALVAYIVWILAFIPTTLAELSLGYVFGAGLGYVIDYSGKLVGSSACYFLGRTMLRPWLHEHFAQQPTLRAVEAAVASRPYRTAFLLRIAYIPFPLKNYGVAMMGMPPLPFFAALVSVEIFDSYIPIAIGSTAKDLQDLLSGEYTPEQVSARPHSRRARLGRAALPHSLPSGHGADSVADAAGGDGSAQPDAGRRRAARAGGRLRLRRPPRARVHARGRGRRAGDTAERQRRRPRRAAALRRALGRAQSHGRGLHRTRLYPAWPTVPRLRAAGAIRMKWRV